MKLDIRGAAALIGMMAAAAPASAQENKFAVSARVVGTYDTNTLRRNSLRFVGPRDNFAVSPRIGIDYSRRFGRQRLFLNGTLGYNFNDRFKFLDREDINLTAGSNLRFGARCQINPLASLYRAQSDLDDLGATIRNTVTIQDYIVEASCPKSVGLYPTLSGGLFRVDNSGVRRDRDQTQVEGRFGLLYRQPSLGDAELFGEVVNIKRGRRVPTATGLIEDQTDIVTVGLRLSRSVGTRISASASAGYTDVDPQSPGVPDFSGVTYRGSLSYALRPGYSLSAGFGRSVSARGNVGSSYYISNTADVDASARLSARTSIGGGIQFAERRFRGEDAGFLFGPRGNDRQLTATARASYALAEPLALSLSARYRDRNADNDFYDFSSFLATLSASLRL